VFLYGKEVDDFHTLDKQKLFALNFSATQEIDRIQQAQVVDISLNKVEIDILKKENQSLKNEITQLKSQMSDLLTRITALEN
jgi:FtsZ-binding cell division protein ZapB